MVRVVIAGTTFGQVYLHGVDHAEGFELAGVLGQGSSRSRACAERHGVPLYTGVDQLPDDIGAACVVVRSGLLGGHGSELAQALLARGIPVLQEHPLHRDELAACLRVARRHGAVHWLNSFYPEVEPVARFVAAARRLAGREPLQWVDAACSFQLAYSLLDIVGRCLGGIRPWALGAPAEVPAPAGRAPGAPPFRTIQAVLGGVPVVLRVQNQLDPADPDNHSHVMHRITVGSARGSLTLVDTHGPVVWSHRPRYPRLPRDESSVPYFSRPGDDPTVSATVVGPAAGPSFDRIFRDLWAGAVARALRSMMAATGDGTALAHGQYHLSLCDLWRDLTDRLGPPDRLVGDELPPWTDEDVTALLAAELP